MQGLTPELAIPLLDTLIDRSEPAPEVFRWLVLRLTEKYLQSNVMVYDEIYVHLVQGYFATGKVTWLAPSVVDEQVERAAKWERLLVGREAPELILFDTLDRAWSLHHMPGRYTLLLFWSPTCGHCRTIIPEIYKVFERVADSVDMTAFAILSEPEEHTIEKWKKFLADHGMTHPRWINLNGGEANVDWREVYDVETTPQVYLVSNKDHRFLAKKLNAQLLSEICKTLK
jgi:thiol-disulfide isomerase/thioredoxin